MSNRVFVTLLLLLFPCVGVTADVPQNAIPIEDQVTIAKCGGCHLRSENGVMRRLSYIRTTPEVWEQAIKRMVRLHGVTVSREDASHIVRYLSTKFFGDCRRQGRGPVFEWNESLCAVSKLNSSAKSDTWPEPCVSIVVLGEKLGLR
jgi:hypothetical protein